MLRNFKHVGSDRKQHVLAGYKIRKISHEMYENKLRKMLRLLRVEPNI